MARFRSSEVYSRVVGKRRFQMLGQSFEVVTKLFELAVGHRRHRVSTLKRNTGVGPEGGRDGPEERAARRPPRKHVRGEKMSLTSSPTSPRANAKQPLLIPAWGTSRACSLVRGRTGVGFQPKEKKRERQSEIGGRCVLRVNV